MIAAAAFHPSLTVHPLVLVTPLLCLSVWLGNAFAGIQGPLPYPVVSFSYPKIPGFLEWGYLLPQRYSSMFDIFIRVASIPN